MNLIETVGALLFHKINSDCPMPVTGLEGEEASEGEGALGIRRGAPGGDPEPHSGGTVGEGTRERPGVRQTALQARVCCDLGTSRGGSPGLGGPAGRHLAPF